MFKIECFWIFVFIVITLTLSGCDNETANQNNNQSNNFNNNTNNSNNSNNSNNINNINNSSNNTNNINNTSNEQYLYFDIIINGGSFGAVASALEAARIAPDARILFIEPTDMPGGQATSQGVSAIDNPWHEPAASLMRNYPELYYASDYLEFIDALKNIPVGAPGYGMAPDGTSWVSRHSYDPRTAVWILESMLGSHPGITVFKNTVVHNLSIQELPSGKFISSIGIIKRSPSVSWEDRFLSEEIHDWYDVTDSYYYTKTLYRIQRESGFPVFIDASELGDLIVLSGADYTVGRERSTEYLNTDGSVPEMDEGGSQAFVFPFCMTDASVPDSEDILKIPFSDFDHWYNLRDISYFSLRNFTWERVWSYRRIKNGGLNWQFDNVNQGDVSMQNWEPGNDYVWGSFLKNKIDSVSESPWKGGLVLSHLRNSEMHALAWYFYMKAHRTSTWDTAFIHGDHPLNMMNTKHGLSRFPYIRGTRRIIGFEGFRITERYFSDTEDPNWNHGTSFRFYDSVGIGSYAVDIHPSLDSEGIVPSISKPAPFYIPLRSLISRNISNLLAGGKLYATTYITNAAYRLHPIEWSAGSAAGNAAAYMFLNSIPNSDLMIYENLRSIQSSISENSPISWAAYDSMIHPGKCADLIINNNRKVTAGNSVIVEIYCYKSAHARVSINGNFVGTTISKTNGALIFEIPSAPSSQFSVNAVIRSSDGNLLCTVDSQTP